MIPDSGATWTCFLSKDFNPTWNFSFAKISIIKTVGDSIIGTDHYIKLTTSGDEYDHLTTIPPPSYNVHPTNSWRNRYFGLLKDDGSGKIYFRDTLTGIDSLLYDYNALQIGHQLTMSYIFPDTMNPSYSSPIVIAKDSIFLCNQFHKRWIVVDTTRLCDTAAIIEGVGGTFGLVENIPWCLLFESCVYSGLIGFDENGNCQWGGPIADLSFICPIENVKQLFSVSPNPSSGIVSIHMGEHIVNENLQWKLVDRSGKLFCRENKDKWKISIWIAPIYLTECIFFFFKRRKISINPLKC